MKSSRWTISYSIIIELKYVFGCIASFLKLCKFCSHIAECYELISITDYWHSCAFI